VRVRGLVCLVGALGCALGCDAPEPPPAPPAPPLAPGVPRVPPPPVREVAHDDVRAGAVVPDPYHWLEGAPPFERSAAVTIDAQARYARRTLAAIDERRGWRVALAKADRGSSRLVVEAVTGGDDHPRFFLSELAPDQDVFRLYVRDGARGADRLLVDPSARDKPGHRHSLAAVLPAPGGERVAYVVQDDGDESGAIEVLDVETGERLRDRLAAQGAFGWRADGRALFYAWGRGVWMHLLGTDQDDDIRIFDGATVGANDVAVYAYPGAAWDVAIAGDGISRGPRILVASADDVTAGRASWREIAGSDDVVVETFARGDDVYLLVGAGAAGGPGRAVVKVDARHGSLATGVRVLAPDPGELIEAVAPAADALYVAIRARGAFRLERVPWQGGAPVPVPQPPGTSVAWFQTRTQAGVVFEADAWTRSPSWESYDPAHGTIDLALAPVEIDPDTVVDEATAVSRDGTAVRLTILHARTHGSDAPAILEGYGAYGSSALPSYDRAVRAWIARGGVWAHCDTRGGGGWMTPWHLAGIRGHKEDAVDDFIACAETLVARGDTTAARLIAYSYSAGGVLVGGAITKRPELFAAAVLRSPVGDLAREDAIATGRFNESEYGDPRDPDAFKAILASDPYHRVRDGVRYPGVMFSVGAQDARVANWQAVKLAARLQHASASGRAVIVRVDDLAGHKGGDRAQRDDEWADLFAFARWQAGLAAVR
jgi:prolyl oligopeptidase